METTDSGNTFTGFELSKITVGDRNTLNRAVDFLITHFLIVVKQLLTKAVVNIEIQAGAKALNRKIKRL